MTYEIWMKERYERFQKIFKDLTTYVYEDEQERTGCFEVVVGNYMFRLWIAEEEYARNTPEQRDKLWLVRLKNIKWEIEEHKEPFNSAIAALEEAVI